MSFTAANRAFRIIFVAETLATVEANTADRKGTVTSTNAFTSLISSIFILNLITLVRGREGTSTVVAVLLPVGQGEGGVVEGGAH